MAQATNSKLFRESVLKQMNDADIVIAGINHPREKDIERGRSRSRKLTLRDLANMPRFKMDKDKS